MAIPLWGVWMSTMLDAPTCVDIPLKLSEAIANSAQVGSQHTFRR